MQNPIFMITLANGYGDAVEANSLIEALAQVENNSKEFEGLEPEPDPEVWESIFHRN